MKIIALMVLVAFLSLPTVTLSDEYETNLMWNGRIWNEYHRSLKMVYVRAVRDAVINFGGCRDKNPRFGRFFSAVGGVALEDLVSALDERYSDPANVNLPILAVMEVEVERIKGIITPVIAEVKLQSYRRFYSDLE